MALNHCYNWLSSLIKTCIPKHTKHKSSSLPWISQWVLNIIKRLHTARKKYTNSQPKVLHLIEETETNGEMEKAYYEQSLASEQSTEKNFQ